MLTSSAVLVVLFAVSSCNSNPTQTVTETPTSGNIKMSIDESFQQLFDTELYTFLSFYKNAQIKPAYKPELDVIEDFMNDSVRNIVTARKLTQEQEDYLKSQQIVCRTTVIASDGIALIVNPQNPDTVISYQTVKDIFAGKTNNWKNVNGKSSIGGIKVVFDNKKSANVRYLMEKFQLKDLPSNCFAANSNAEVINYVKNHKDALGVISVNWISDKDDSLSISFLKEIKVMAIGSEFDPNPSDYYRPYAAYIKKEYYPLRREVYMISRETFTGLGSGFIQFVAGEKGQRIVLKSGMVPSTMPTRVMQIKSE